MKCKDDVDVRDLSADARDDEDDDFKQMKDALSPYLFTKLTSLYGILEQMQVKVI